MTPEQRTETTALLHRVLRELDAEHSVTPGSELHRTLQRLFADKTVAVEHYAALASVAREVTRLRQQGHRVRGAKGRPVFRHISV